MNRSRFLLLACVLDLAAMDIPSRQSAAELGLQRISPGEGLRAYFTIRASIAFLE
jgi:hypothetical protein